MIVDSAKRQRKINKDSKGSDSALLPIWEEEEDGAVGNGRWFCLCVLPEGDQPGLAGLSLAPLHGW